MKKTLTLITSAFLFAGSAQAGRSFSDSTSLVPAPTTASCFNGTEIQLDGFGVANFQDDQTRWGGGVGLNYYFTPFVGIGGDIYWSKLEGSWTHNMSASGLFRIPIESWCSAIYFFGGGGLHSNSSNVGTAHIGGGFEWRPVGRDGVGIFTDIRYTWVDSDTLDDSPQLRMGLRAFF